MTSAIKITAQVARPSIDTMECGMIWICTKCIQSILQRNTVTRENGTNYIKKMTVITH